MGTWPCTAATLQHEWASWANCGREATCGVAAEDCWSVASGPPCPTTRGGVASVMLTRVSVDSCQREMVASIMALPRYPVGEAAASYRRRARAAGIVCRRLGLWSERAFAQLRWRAHQIRERRDDGHWPVSWQPGGGTSGGPRAGAPWAARPLLPVARAPARWTCSPHCHDARKQRSRARSCQHSSESGCFDGRFRGMRAFEA